MNNIDREVRRLQGLRRRVWCVLSVAVAVSLAANVAHAWPHGGLAAAWAAWPPVALVLVVEVISKVPVAKGWLSLVRLAGAAAIAAVAAWVSYWHMVGLGETNGEAADAAHLVPLAVDGLAVVATVSLVELSGRIASAEAQVRAVEAAELEARRATAAAEQQAAEAAQRAAEAAEQAAELERQQAAEAAQRAAELERQQAAEAAQRAAELERQERLATQRQAAEQAAQPVGRRLSVARTVTASALSDGRVLDAFPLDGEEIRTSAIRDVTGLGATTVTEALGRLNDQGLIETVRRGVYRRRKVA